MAVRWQTPVYSRSSSQKMRLVTCGWRSSAAGLGRQRLCCAGGVSTTHTLTASSSTASVARSGRESEPMSSYRKPSRAPVAHLPKEGGGRGRRVTAGVFPMRQLTSQLVGPHPPSSFAISRHQPPPAAVSGHQPPHSSETSWRQSMVRKSSASTNAPNGSGQRTCRKCRKTPRHWQKPVQPARAEVSRARVPGGRHVEGGA